MSVKATPGLLLLYILLLLYAITNGAAVISNRIISSYDPAEILSNIFKPNITLEPRQRVYGSVKFEDELDPISSNSQDQGQYGLIEIQYERDPRPLKFAEDYGGQNTNDNQQNYNENRPVTFDDSDTSQDLNGYNGGQVTFQDDNKIDDLGNKKRRKRRRRKPKNGQSHYSGTSGSPPGNLGYQGSEQGGYGLNNYGSAGSLGAQPYRRPRRRRPRPSLATEALTSITEALTSIARYDDYQCVPRLLCEAAGGGALGDNGVLQSIAGIQPLLTLLSGYNGISTSPLFVFGRAVFLGMTSRGNAGTCRYAYSQCPTDPEQLIHYLNNHNGGFFRFFSAPQPQNQNLEQFYNQLGQGYGLYQPYPAQQITGYPNNLHSEQSYGNYQNNHNFNNPGSHYIQNYGLQRPDKVSLYNNNNQNYGSNYGYDYDNYGANNQIRFKDNDARIEKRIQNNPSNTILADDSFEDDVKTKWHFPDHSEDKKNDYNIRDSRTLKFPEEGKMSTDIKESNRNGKKLYFSREQYYQSNYEQPHQYTNNNNRYQTTTYAYSNSQSNQNYFSNRLNTYNNNNYKYTTPSYNIYENNNKFNIDNYQNNKYYNNRQNIYNNDQKYPSTVFNNEEYVFDHKHNFYVKKEINNLNRHEDDGFNTVYVVRGNGDPNKPEIVKLRPGQTLPLY